MKINKELFIYNELNKPYVFKDINSLIENLKDNKRVIFTKFGDGEYLCMTLKYEYSRNCDGDTYTNILGELLRNAFINLCIRSKTENIYIGKWNHTKEPCNFFLDIYYDYLNKNNINIISVPFVDYHFCYPDNNFNKNKNCYNFVKSIQDYNNYKIVISNENNKNLFTIFKCNLYINISNNSWFTYYYNKLLDKLKKILNHYPNSLILMAGGLATKVLLDEITYLYPNVSFIDIGSGFDILATKQKSRAWGDENNYIKQLEYFKDLLPSNYN